MATVTPRWMPLEKFLPAAVDRAGQHPESMEIDRGEEGGCKGLGVGQRGIGQGDVDGRGDRCWWLEGSQAVTFCDQRLIFLRYVSRVETI